MATTRHASAPSGSAPPHAHLVSRAALVTSIGATTLTVSLGRRMANDRHLEAIAVSCAAYAIMLVADRRWGGLNLGLVVAATAVPVAAALGVMPRNGDLWSYAMYGRMLGVDHVSPWTHVPAGFPHDPFRELVGRSWAHTPSVYGPVFNALSGAGAAFLGRSVLSTRLFYQSLAALALGGSALLVWRHTGRAAAVAFLTVHPLVVLYLVNPGRNDILVGAAMLAAVLLSLRGRPAASGAVGALGALVKVTGAVGVVALLVTSATSRGRVVARRMAVAAVTVFGVAYLAAGTGALLAPMQTAGALYSRASPWSLLPTLGIAQPSPHVPLAILAVLVAVVIVRHARSAPGTAVAASSATLALAASYTLPGYAAWGLPAAALDHRSRVSRIVAATGVVLLLTYETLRHPVPGPTGSTLHTVAATGGPLLMILLVLALLRTRAHPEEVLPPMTLTEIPEPVAGAVAAPGTGPRTLVVLPTLDEVANVGAVLVAIRRGLPSADVLVVDDGSTDGTVEAARAVAHRLGCIRVLCRTGPRGLGPAYRAGFAVGLGERYDVLVEMDADCSHDPSALPALVAAVLDGADLAIGSRYVPGGETPGWPARRRLLSRAGGWYARSLLRLDVRDVTSGYRAYRADLLEAIDLESTTTTGYAFQIDMTERARRLGASIREVPIVFRDRTSGTSKMSGAIVAEALLMVTRRALRPRPTAGERPLRARAGFVRAPTGESIPPGHRTTAPA